MIVLHEVIVGAEVGGSPISINTIQQGLEDGRTHIRDRNPSDVSIVIKTVCNIRKDLAPEIKHLLVCREQFTINRKDDVGSLLIRNEGEGL